ncbi:MAG: manganese efflux pump [Clostridiales bacterium]|nr:manganese efflux pump [Clostridiales bacterium]
MDYVSLVGIAVGLSMDAFAVCITNGAVCKRENVNARFALRLAFSFGFFQALMPMIGWLIGKAGESLISSIDHWIALLLLSYLGGRMIYESVKKQRSGEQEDCRADNVSFRTLMALSVATSIDALATGLLLPSAVGAYSLSLMLISVGTIGLITFCIGFCGVFLGKTFGMLIAGKAEILGGVVLIGIGLKIFIEHMFL